MRHATLVSSLSERNAIRRRNWLFVRVMMGCLYVAASSLIVITRPEASWSEVAPIMFSWLVVASYVMFGGE